MGAPVTSSAYRLVARLGATAAALAAECSAGFADGHRGRSRAADQLIGWARTRRDPVQPLIWLHAASAGEGRQAASVIRELRRIVPRAQFASTYFSASARPFADQLGADVHGYLPYDLPDLVDSVLAALRPNLLVFVKLDLWPELATRAGRRGIPVALVAGTVRPGSSRLRFLTRQLTRPGYAALAAAAAVAEPDAARLQRLGAPSDRIAIVGDPRYDSVIHHAHAASDAPLGLDGGSPVVAGSTWPSDEAVVLAAFARLRRSHPAARLIVAPHQPTPARIASVEREATRQKLPRPVPLDEARGEMPPLCIVTRLGALQTIYRAAAMAYVGGGFGRAGLHSVLEPAAWCVPVIFGPRWRESRDASLLLDAGAAQSLPERQGEAAQVLHRIWAEWLDDEARRAEAGAQARKVVELGSGAALQTAALLAGLLGQRSARTGGQGV